MLSIGTPKRVLASWFKASGNIFCQFKARSQTLNPRLQAGPLQPLVVGPLFCGTCKPTGYCKGTLSKHKRVRTSKIGKSKDQSRYINIYALYIYIYIVWLFRAKPWPKMHVWIGVCFGVCFEVSFRVCFVVLGS